MKKVLYYFLPLIGVITVLISCGRKSPAPVNLSCEFRVNPIGIETPQPRFSWMMADTSYGATQTAYQVIVASSAEKINSGKPDIWNSDKVISSQSHLVEFEGDSLQSSSRYYWAVRIWNQNGVASPYSSPAWFETALMHPGDWQAQWIANSSDPENAEMITHSATDKDELTGAPRTPYLVRKPFGVSDSIVSARLYVSGLGGYVAYINGHRVGNDLLSPGFTYYPKRIQYQTYDVTQMIAEGENVLAASLANQWWSGGLGWKGNAVFHLGPLRFIAQLRLQKADGSVQTVVTDTSWRWNSSPILSSTIYDGEAYDATREEKGWNTPGFDAIAWKPVQTVKVAGQLTAQKDPAIQVTRTINPIGVTQPSPGIYVFDLGQNMVGRARITTSQPAGTRISLKFAELLHPDGSVAQENLRRIRPTDVYICIGKGTESWAPEFTYHGFRYVQVEGLISPPDSTFLIGEVFNTNLTEVGVFESSNPLLNQIYENTLWGQRGNLMSVPTDCPQRDERLGWMGDAQIFAPTANYNMLMAPLWDKWLNDITDGQHPTEGWVTDVNPEIVVKGPAKPGWGDAVVMVPYQSYRFFADRRILEHNYNAMQKWVNYMYGKSKEYIYEYGDGDWGGYGDWVAVEPSPTKPTGAAYFMYSSRILSEIAGILGYKDDSARYRQWSDKAAEAYHTKYFTDSTGYYLGATQTANLLPLAFGITPESKKPEVFSRFRDNVVARDTHLTTGFLGTAFILPVLSDFGSHELAYRMAVKTTYPSWGYMVEQGATTIWELWNSDKEKPEGMNSRNHFAYGSVVEWYFSHLGGLQPDMSAPGFKHFILAPMPPKGLEKVSIAYQSPYGKIHSTWSQTEKIWVWNFTIPANTTAEVRIPAWLFPNGVVKESGKTIFDKDKGQSTKYLHFTSSGEKWITFQAVAGNYTITAE